MKVSGEILAIIASIFIGLSVPIASQASRSVGVIQATTYTSLISVAFLAAIGVLSKERILIKESLTRHLKDSLSVVISRPVIGNLLLIYGFSLTTAIKASFLLLLEPIFVTPISYILLRDRVNKRQVLLIGFLIMGAFLISTNGVLSSITQTQIGDFMVVLALLFFSYSYIPAKKLGEAINPITVTIINNLLGGLILFSIMLLLHINLFTINLSNAWLVIGYVLTFSVIGLYLYFSALRKTKPWIVSSLLTLSAVTGATVGYFWLHETIGIVQFLGAIIILTSSYFIAKVNAK